METLESLLADHRRDLIAFMEDWSKQQELLLSKYAGGTQDTRREIATRRMLDSCSTVVQQKTSNSEPVVCSDQVAPCGGVQASKDGAKPDFASVVDTTEGAGTPPVRLASKETEGIRAVVSDKSLSEIPLSRPAPSGRGRMEKIVDSTEFGFVISFVILCNSLFMAIAADRIVAAAQTGRRGIETRFSVVEAVFTSTYVIELSARLVVLRRKFFCGSEWRWNVFDLIVVLTALTDFIPPGVLGATINMSFLRVSRPLKLLKMLRIVKVYRSFKQLRLILASILGCAKTMFWAFALLTIVIFTFSLIFVQAVADYARAKHQDDWNADIMQYWGSTPKAMNTLFQAGTGGADWAQAAEPLWDLGWAYYAAFLSYICFFMFVVVNVLTAVFVDAALDSSMKDDSILIEDEIQNKLDYIRRLGALYHRLDDDGSGVLSWTEFHRGLHSPEMVAFASTLDIEVADISEFFRLISCDGRDEVDLESFVVGCMKLKGAAKSLDVVSLLHRTKHMERAVAAVAEKTDDHLQEVQRLLGRVLDEQERVKVTSSGQLSIANPGTSVSGVLASSPRSAFDCEDFSRDISV